MRRASCIVRQNLKTNIQTSFFYKTIAPTVLKFYMEHVIKFHLKHDQTLGFQNYEFGLGQESKMAAVTKNSKTIKINFFSGTIRYDW